MHTLPRVQCSLGAPRLHGAVAQATIFRLWLCNELIVGGRERVGLYPATPLSGLEPTGSCLFSKMFGLKPEGCTLQCCAVSLHIRTQRMRVSFALVHHSPPDSGVAVCWQESKCRTWDSLRGTRIHPVC